MDGVHDMGGMHGFGPVVEPGGGDVFHAEWEARVFALHMLISFERLGAGPGGRPTREEMPPDEYLAAGYYDRWLWSAERRLERAGRIQPGEVEAAMARLAAGGETAATSSPQRAAEAVAWLEDTRPLDTADAPRFAAGDPVRVRRMRPTGHTRCPRYARGVPGIVERVHGAQPLPDRAVYGQPAAAEAVYGVAFRSHDLWGDDGEAPFTVLLDLWESYLEPVSGRCAERSEVLVERSEATTGRPRERSGGSPTHPRPERSGGLSTASAASTARASAARSAAVHQSTRSEPA